MKTAQTYKKNTNEARTKISKALTEEFAAQKDGTMAEIEAACDKASGNGLFRAFYTVKEPKFVPVIRAELEKRGFTIAGQDTEIIIRWS